MNIKKAKHTLLKTIITLAIIEGIYLYALPFALNSIAKTNCFKNIVNSKTNVNLNYENVVFKTHFKPALTIKTKNLTIEEKENNIPFLQTDKAQIKVALLPLLTGKIAFKNIISNNINIRIERDENGLFNIEKLFPKKENGFFKLSLGNSVINIDNDRLKLMAMQRYEKDEFLSIIKEYGKYSPVFKALSLDKSDKMLAVLFSKDAPEYLTVEFLAEKSEASAENAKALLDILWGVFKDNLGPIRKACIEGNYYTVYPNPANNKLQLLLSVAYFTAESWGGER